MKTEFNSLKYFKQLIDILKKDNTNNGFLESSNITIEICEFLEQIFNEGNGSQICNTQSNEVYDLKLIRKSYKLTQTQFAKELGTTRSLIAKLETNDYTFSNKFKIKVACFLKSKESTYQPTPKTKNNSLEANLNTI